MMWLQIFDEHFKEMLREFNTVLDPGSSKRDNGFGAAVHVPVQDLPPGLYMLQAWMLDPRGYLVGHLLPTYLTHCSICLSTPLPTLLSHVIHYRSIHAP